MIKFIEEDLLLGFGLLALADVHQHVYRPEYTAILILDRGRKGKKREEGAIRTLRHSLHATDRALLFQGRRHGALIMRQELAIGGVDPERDAPLVFPDL